MGRFLRIINGMPRMADESSSPSIYDEYIDIVASGAGANEIDVDDGETGDPITLPDSGTYEGNELEIYLNGNRMEDVADYNWLGSGTRTQISFTFDLEVGDRVRFRVDRDL